MKPITAWVILHSDGKPLMDLIWDGPLIYGKKATAKGFRDKLPSPEHTKIVKVRIEVVE